MKNTKKSMKDLFSITLNVIAPVRNVEMNITIIKRHEEKELQNSIET